MIPPDALHVLDCLLVVCVIDSSRVIPIFFYFFYLVSCLFSSSFSSSLDGLCVIFSPFVVISFALVAFASATHHAAWGG